MTRRFDAYGLSLTYRAPSVMEAPHRHSEIELNLIDAGSVVYHFGGRRFVLHAGQIAAFWGATPHQLVHSDADASYFCLTLPLALVMAWELPGRFLRGLLDGQPLLDAPADAALDHALFARWTADLESRDEELRAIVLLEVEARLRRMARASPAASEPARADGKAEAMARYIAQHYLEPLTIEQIARSVHLQPNYAMTLYRRAFHITLHDTLTQYRVAHAQRLLATTDRTIDDIAYASGFRSHSRFYEAFRLICGRSPGEYRRLLSEPVPPGLTSEGQPPADTAAGQV